MGRNPLTITKKISNRFSWNYKYLFRSREKTVYHCCIQKSGSQWFKKIFNDQIFWQQNKLLLYAPVNNFITEDQVILQKLNKLPKDLIISPLYLRYSDFNKLQKPENYKAFYIARDPRDLIISNYFSLKYSHDPYHPYILMMREKLNSMSQDDGITKIINSFTTGTKKTLEEWFTQRSENIKLILFEDIFGEKQFEVFSELLKHCEINLLINEIKTLLKKYSFTNISGRKQGDEDVKHHYRKGIPGDWKNYFTEQQKDIFKNLSGDLLITCGYEKDNNW
ncbi:MAG: sulfotransferase family 2 domain-containing protein [Planctomycetia bacterium]|nr:sulfotransferase family 2 domain-containing protein [Planctomycetia bacterium]